jgi:hypothetical protein
MSTTPLKISGATLRAHIREESYDEGVERRVEPIGARMQKGTGRRLTSRRNL